MPWRGQEEAATGQETFHCCPYPVQVATASDRRDPGGFASSDLDLASRVFTGYLQVHG